MVINNVRNKYLTKHAKLVFSVCDDGDDDGSGTLIKTFFIIEINYCARKQWGFQQKTTTAATAAAAVDNNIIFYGIRIFLRAKLSNCRNDGDFVMVVERIKVEICSFIRQHSIVLNNISNGV